MEGAGERCLSKAIAAQSLWENSVSRKGPRREPCGIRGAATAGTSPEHPPATRKEGERASELWGEGTRIITRAGLIAINIKNQINMSRCAFHFPHICGA